MTLVCLTLALGVGVVQASDDLPGSDRRIATFWSWWQSAHAKFEGKDAPASRELADEMSRRLESIAPGLVWEFGRAGNGTHVLTVSPEGDFATRKITERWLRAAPREPSNWTYYPARQPEPGLEGFVLEVGGKKFDAARLRFALIEEAPRTVVHLTVVHPEFATASSEVATQAKFLLVDWVLGEDDVERFVGRVDSSPKVPPPAATISEVRSAIERLRAAAARPATWSLLKSREGDRPPWTAVLNLGLKRLDHLSKDWHLTVSFPVRHPAPTGLPSSGADLTLLQSAEDAVVEALGPGALSYGHRTGEGRYDVFFYLGDRARAERLLRDWIRQTPGIGAAPRWELDPEWKLYQRW